MLHVQDQSFRATAELSVPAGEPAFVTFDGGASSYALMPRGDAVVDVQSVPPGEAGKWRRADEAARVKFVPLQQIELPKGTSRPAEAAALSISAKFDESDDLSTRVEEGKTDVLQNAEEHGLSVLNLDGSSAR